MGNWVAFPLLTVVNDAAVNSAVQVSLQDPAFNYSGNAPRSEIGGSASSSIFNFLTSILFFTVTVLLYIWSIPFLMCPLFDIKM